MEYSSDEDQLGAEFAHLRLRAEEEVEEIEEEVENLYTMAIQSAERTLLDLHVTSKVRSPHLEQTQPEGTWKQGLTQANPPHLNLLLLLLSSTAKTRSTTKATRAS